MTKTGPLDVLYFLAELVVYVAVTWWGFSRDVPTAGRWLLGLGLLAAFVASWALLAAPRARFPLHGRRDTAFRVVWFGLGLAAAVALIAG